MRKISLMLILILCLGCSPNIDATGYNIAFEAVRSDSTDGTGKVTVFDFGMTAIGINRVIVGFDENEFPGAYEILMSENGQQYDVVYRMLSNKSGGKRMHSFTPVNARYMKIKYGAEAKIGEVEVYCETDSAVKAEFLQRGAEVTADTDIKVDFGKKITGAYASKVKLYGENGEISASAVQDGTSVILNPAENLKSGGRYKTVIPGFQSSEFGVKGEKITPSAVQMYSIDGVKRTAWSYPAKNSIDGKSSTYAELLNVENNGNYAYALEVDFGSNREDITGLEINFIKTPALYKVLASEDGYSWSVIGKEYTYGNARQLFVVNEEKLRYIRVENVQGDMAVSEIFGTTNTNIEALEVEIFTENEIKTEFSQKIDKNTITAETVILKNGEKTVECEFYIEDNTVEINPKLQLEQGVMYTLILTSGIKDCFGNALCEVKKEFMANSALRIVTKSDDYYDTDPENSIYPAFADNMPYEVWTEEGNRDFFSIKADGGVKPYKFSVVGGKLPDGFAMSENGEISGSPVKEGTFSFTVRVTDAKGGFSDKMLSMTVNPYRSKWFRDAKFGFMVQWGAFAYPSVTSVAEIANFEKRMTEFDADAWAQQIYDAGGRVLNFTCMAGDSIRMWPSKSATEKEAKTTRNYVGELIEACHSRGIKFIAYVAGTYSWNGATLDAELITGSQAEMTKDMVSELLDMGVDGFWFDCGCTYGWIDYDDVVALIRSKNPFATVQINSWHNQIKNYPDADIQIFECPEGSVNDNDLIVGIPADVKKKMATEVTGLLTKDWGFVSPHGPYTSKSAEGMIQNIKENWNNGCTYLLVVPQSEKGGLVHPFLTDKVKTITDWTAVNVQWTQTPKISLSNGKISITSENGAEIYYTTDGREPTEQSAKYTQPIDATVSVRIKARAFKSGKYKSEVSEEGFVISSGNTQSMLTSKPSGTIVREKLTRKNGSLMTGMLVTVGAKPVILNAIGRYKTGNDGGNKIISVKPVNHKEKSILREVLSPNGDADSLGFVYKEFAPVRLEAYKAYWILCEETGETSYLRTDFTETTNGMYIDEGAASSADILIMHDGNDVKGQLLNLKFITLEGTASENMARGAKVTMYDSSGNKAVPSSEICYAQYAVDGDPQTAAMSGSTYSWSLVADLRESKNIKTIEVDFMPELYATEYIIYTSTNGSRWIQRESVTDNSSINISYTYKPVLSFLGSTFSARYIKIEAVKPDAAGQPGTEMAIADLRVY